MAETYVTLSSLKHYDEKIKEVIDEKQDQLVGTEGQVVSFDADGNVISKNLNVSGEEPFVGEFYFKYTDDNSGFEIYNPTFTNDEVIQAVNDDRVVILKGHISTARDYAPYVFNLHRYARNSGSYEFICHYYYTTNTIQIYNLIIRSYSVTLMQDNYDMTKQDLSSYQTLLTGTEGQIVGFNADGEAVAVDFEGGNGVEVSTEEGNQIETKDDGIYVAPTDLSNYYTKTDIGDITNLSTTEKEVVSSINEIKELVDSNYTELTTTNEEIVTSLTKDFNWKEIRTLDNTFTCLSIRMCLNQLVAVGSGNAQIYINTGYNSWSSVKLYDTSYNDIDMPSVKDIACNDDVFVVIGESGGLCYSTNKTTTWTRVTSLDSVTFTSIIYANGMFVAVGLGGIIYQSTDGMTFTQIDSGISVDLHCITYADNMFVVGGSKAFYKSTDATTWTLMGATIQGFTAYSISYGNDRFIAVGSGGKKVYYFNGSRWINASGISTASSIIPSCVTYASDRFITICTSGKTYYSTDGKNFISASEDIISADYQSIIYDDNKSRVITIGNDCKIYSIELGFEDVGVSLKDLRDRVNTLETNNTVTIDDILSKDSTNSVQNKVIYEALEQKVDKIDGKGLSSNDLTDDLLKIINSDHTYAGYQMTTETNLDNITARGRYSIDNSTGNKTNCPSDITRFDLYVATYTRYIVQIAVGVKAATNSTTVVPTPTIWVRAKDTMTYNWSTWSMPSSSYATNAGKVNNHTVESDVPADAKFTDTITTVTTTGSGNAITSISSTDGVVTATKGSTFLTAHPTISKSTDTTSTATATHGGTITMVDSVTRDGNGHVTKINTKTVTLPSDADTKYTHPTTSGNKHIPSGGSSGQILRWSADGTAVWGADNNTTYSAATTSANGLMTSTMVTKLNGIAEGANKYTLPTASSSTLGGVKTTSTVTSNSGYTACPIISGVPYYKPTSGADASIYQSNYIAYDGTPSGTRGGIEWGQNINVTSSGSPTYVIGNGCASTSGASFTTGYYTKSNNAFCMVIGKYNKLTTSNDAHRYVSWMANRIEAIDAFVIGNGTSDTARGNAFRVTAQGATYGLSAFNSSGADYAEFVSEWADGNPNWEDRVGYFVTLKDNKLYKANDGDYILGITSGNPSVVGNGDETYFWKYERDEFNRFIYEDKPILDEEGNEIANEESGEVYTAKSLVISEDYDPTLQYIARKDRPEWDYVGMTGVIPVRDDGTCVVDGYCKCGVDGIATLATEKSDFTYFVKERISDNVISVIIR